MNSWRKKVEVTCPSCDYKRLAQMRSRGLVRMCRSCKIKLRRSEKVWATRGVLHLESYTPLYRVWNAMKQRCDLSTNVSYHRYGGRGINYCQEWKEFVPFRDWAMQNGYAKGLLLDRQNNDGNYEPSNCRWVTPAVSAANRSPIIRNEKGQYLPISSLP